MEKKVNKNYVVMVAVGNQDTDWSMDSISDNEDLSSLFSTEDTDTDNEEAQDDNNPDLSELFKDNIQTEGLDPEEVSEENEDNQDSGRAPTDKVVKPSHLSSILTALKDDGVLPDIDNDAITKATSPEDFASLIESQVNARLDARSKRIAEALDNNVPTDVIQNYENAISYLDSLSEESISEASASGEQLRKQLIYQDFLNKGFKPERATREAEKSITAGTDLEDAVLALESNKEFFTESYHKQIRENKTIVDAQRVAIKEEQEKFNKMVTETTEPFPGIKLDSVTRNKILTNATKVIDKGEDGVPYTKLQKFIKDNPSKAQYYLSLFYTLTDEFSNLNKLIGKSVVQQTNKKVSNIEKVLNSSATFNDSGNSIFKKPADEQSKFFNLKLDI